MATKIGSIFAEFTAQTAGFQQGLQQVQDGMAKTRKSVEEHTSAMEAGFDGINKVMEGLGVGLSIAGIIEVLKKISESFIAIKEGAVKANVSIEEFQVLDYIARNNAASIEKVVMGLDHLETKLQSAMANNKQTLEIFKELGISVGTLESMSGGERFAALGKALKESSDEARTFYLIAELLGKKLTPELREALLGAADGMDKWTDAAKKNKQVIDSEFIEKYDKSMESLGNLWKRFVVTEISEPITYFQKLHTEFETSTNKIDTLKNAFIHLGTEGIKVTAMPLGRFISSFIPGLDEWQKKLEGVTEAQKKQTEQQKLSAEAAAAAEQKFKKAAIDAGIAATLQAEAVAKNVGDLIIRLGILQNMQATAKFVEEFKAVEPEIKKTQEAIDSMFVSLKKGAETSGQKFADINRFLTTMLTLGRIDSDQFVTILKHYNTGLQEFASSIATVDPKEALALKVDKIKEKIKDLATMIGPAKAQMVGIAEILNATAATPQAQFAKSEREKELTAFQKQQEEIVKIKENANLNMAGGLFNAEAKRMIDDITSGLRDQRAQLDQEVASLEKTATQWGISRDQARAFSEQIANAKTPEAIRNIQTSLTKLSDHMKLMKDIGKEMTDGLSQGLADAIVNGESLGKVFQNVGKTILSMILQAGLKSMLGGIFGSIFGGAFGAMFHAQGGNANMGDISVVGENGPELRVERSAATYFNKDQLNAMGSKVAAPQINFQLYAYDTAGMSQMIDQKTPAIVAKAMTEWQYQHGRGKL